MLGSCEYGSYNIQQKRTMFADGIKNTNQLALK